MFSARKTAAPSRQTTIQVRGRVCLLRVLRWTEPVIETTRSLATSVERLPRMSAWLVGPPPIGEMQILRRAVTAASRKLRVAPEEFVLLVSGGDYGG